MTAPKLNTKVCVIIPNWNGAKELPSAIESILQQSFADFILVIVDNGSSDDSLSIIENYQAKDRRVHAIWRDKNYGYTGGVNPGFEMAIREDIPYAAPFNNDAKADKHWLERLVAFMDTHPAYGIVACSILHEDGLTIDSTADQYSVWGLAFPRGRDLPAKKRFDYDHDIFGASGGASLYRVAMLQKIGLFDQDFFAYYEDIDLSFRAQLAGYKVRFVPEAVVYHAVGKTSDRLAKKTRGHGKPNDFLTKQYMKNLPFVFTKDVPATFFPRILPRFILAYSVSFLKALLDGRGGSAISGAANFWWKLPKKLCERHRIQKTRTASNEYLWNLLVHDLPPQADKLRKLRSRWWRIRGKNSTL